MHRCTDEDPAIPYRAFARVMRAHAHWRIRENDVAGLSKDFRDNATWLRSCHRRNRERERAPVGSTVGNDQWRTHMVEGDDISALRFTVRLIRRRGVARIEGREKVTRNSASLEARRRGTIVHDVEGSIVTGVLGGD
jgi:hypothetical protein